MIRLSIRNKYYNTDSVIDAIALGRHWRFWSFGLKEGGWLADFGDNGGRSQMEDHKKCRGYVNFELKL